MGSGHIVLQVVAFLMAIVIHESAHAWSADRLGDPTARLLGRVTLNPLAHIDLVGTVLMPALLIIAGLPAIGYAKPVPVNPLNLRVPRRDHAIISAAGPLSNLALALVFIIIFHIAARNMGHGLVSQGILWLIYYGALINVILAAFNLIPVPPLDGSGILSGFLSPKAAATLQGLQPYGFIILLGLWLLGGLEKFIVFFITLTQMMLGV